MRADLLRLRLETRWLLLVTACYVIAQPLLFHMHRFWDYDEAVYVSQVYPGAVRDIFEAHRAMGVPWLVSPVAAFSPPVVIIRYYVLVVFGTGLFAAFRTWVPVVRMRAVAAAALFAAGWVTLYYGAEVLPNLPVAFGGIGAAGSLAQHLSPALDDRTRNRALVTAAAIALTAVLRPSDAAFFAAGALVVAVTANWRVLAMRCAVLIGGLVAGLLPWVIQAYLSYGGLAHRLSASSALALSCTSNPPVATESGGNREHRLPERRSPPALQPSQDGYAVGVEELDLPLVCRVPMH